jgi:hypothetical protein
MKNHISELLIGTLLGDASVRKTSFSKAYISFEQSKKKDKYFKYLYQEMKEYSSSEPKEYNKFDSRYNIKNSSLYFGTKSLEIFKPFADMFLNEKNKKIVPTNIIDLLTPRSLAF